MEAHGEAFAGRDHKQQLGLRERRPYCIRRRSPNRCPAMAVIRQMLYWGGDTAMNYLQSDKRRAETAKPPTGLSQRDRTTDKRPEIIFRGKK